MELKEIWKRLKGIIIFGICYMATFFFMEARDVPIHIIHTEFDDLIPFCEYFIIPYVIWYIYVCGTVLYLGMSGKNLEEYNRFITTMILGMVVFVVISLIYPNGQDLRPDIAADSVFTQAVNFLYTIDTPTNILPSLHVFVSVACDVALCRNVHFKKQPVWQWMIHTLTFFICISTMFLKQHSIIDVLAALLCNVAFYPLVYHRNHITSKVVVLKKRVPTEKL